MESKPKRMSLGAARGGGAPSGDVTTQEVRLVDPATLVPSDENERRLFTKREVFLLLGIGSSNDRREFREDELILPSDIRELTDDKELLSRPFVEFRWKKLVELAQSMYKDCVDGEMPGGILEVMRNESGEKLIITKGHRRQLAGLIANVKVWVNIRDYVASKLIRATQRARENIQREELELPESVKLVSNIMDGLKEEGRPSSQAEVYKEINYSKGWLSLHYRAATTPHLRDAIDAGLISTVSELKSIMEYPEAVQKARINEKLREAGGKDADEEEKVQRTRRRKPSIKLAATKNMEFVENIINAALRLKEIKEHKDALIQGRNLKKCTPEELEEIWKGIVDLANLGAKKSEE